MMSEIAFGCKHTHGLVNGYCVDCSQKVVCSQKQYSAELRRLLEGGINMNNKIVDFKALEKYILQFEDIMKDNELNIVEQDLVLRQALSRVQKRIEEQKARDMVSNMPGMDMAMKLLKRKGGNDET